jgi:hypothetical protein
MLMKNLAASFSEALKTALSALQSQATTDLFARQSSVLWVLLHGRLMMFSQQLSDLTAINRWGPRAGWSRTTGWRITEEIRDIIQQEIVIHATAARFMAISLDESTDSTGTLTFNGYKGTCCMVAKVRIPNA